MASAEQVNAARLRYMIVGFPVEPEVCNGNSDCPDSQASKNAFAESRIELSNEFFEFIHHSICVGF